MKIIYNNIIPFPGFCAMNLFGILFVRNKYKGRLSSRIINHESIHTAQYEELWYIGFLPLYIFFWVKNLFKFGFNHQAYKNIPFELEANDNESSILYLSFRPKFGWKIYC